MNRNDKYIKNESKCLNSIGILPLVQIYCRFGQESCAGRKSVWLVGTTVNPERREYVIIADTDGTSCIFINKNKINKLIKCWRKKLIIIKRMYQV
jgi:hypothetical protein